MSDPQAQVEGRRINLRYPGICTACGGRIAKGEPALHFASTKSVTCVTCPPAARAAAPPRRSPQEQLTSHPGASAQREYERRVQKRQDELKERWGERAGGAVAWWEADKQSTAAWSTGAKGEREVAEYLEGKLAGTACVLLHDRKMPRSRANIDHLIVGPAGVTVLDAKNCKGKVRTERVGFGARRRTILRVNGRDRTALIDGLKKQLDAVRSAVRSADAATTLAVRGGLCWWNYDGLPLFGQLDVDGIPVLSPQSSYKLACEDGPLSADEIRCCAESLAVALPQA